MLIFWPTRDVYRAAPNENPALDERGSILTLWILFRTAELLSDANRSLALGAEAKQAEGCKSGTEENEG
jgi:hypothetical protein